MNFHRPNVYIADLSSETVQELEFSQKDQVFKRFLASILRGGRTEENLTLKKFFLSDALLTSVLRLFCWLGPVPEIGTLLVDWSRAQAGGLPDAVFPILECLSKGRILEAKRIAFAQELISGLADSGDWGGGAYSNINVRVDARNRECCRVLSQLLQGNESDSLRIAVLFGAFHHEDMTGKFREMGLQPVSNSFLTAWTTLIHAPTRDFFSRRVLPIAIVTALYLFLGAIDWYFLVSLSARGIESFLQYQYSSGNLDNSDVSVNILYIVFYIQRHSLLYNRASNLGVQWQTGLFDGTFDNRAS